MQNFNATEAKKKILGELPVGAESHIPINVSVCVHAITTGLLLNWDITARRSQRFFFFFRFHFWNISDYVQM